jgi:hypothetical protein
VHDDVARSFAGDRELQMSAESAARIAEQLALRLPAGLAFELSAGSARIAPEARGAIR